MSGDDHFIKPDNDGPVSDIAHALRKLYRGQPLCEQAAEEIDRLQATNVLWRQTDRALRDEITKHQRNLRHWREECGKLHAKLTIAKHDARTIACGLLHDGLDAGKLTPKARDEIRAAIERLLALAPVTDSNAVGDT